MVEEKSIVCVGLICLDIVTVCRTYPLEGSDQRSVRMKWQKGGNAANTSAVLALLGHAVHFFGVLPKTPEDFFSKQAVAFVREEMESCGVRMEKVTEKQNAAIPSSLVTVNDSNGSRTIIHNKDPVTDDLSYEDFRKLDLKRHSWINFSGRNLEQVELMMRSVDRWNAANSHQVFVSFEMEKPRRKSALLRCLPFAHLVLISQDFGAACGFTCATDCVQHFSTKLKDGVHVVCTWGSAGAACTTAGQKAPARMIPAVSPGNAIDTLGAGDTFLAGVIHSMLSRHGDLQQSVKFACALAGHKVASYGYECVRSFSKKGYQNGNGYQTEVIPNIAIPIE